MAKGQKRASTLGKDLRKFEKVVGNNPQKMYQGQSPAAPDRAALRRVAKRSAAIAEKLDVECRIFMEAFLAHKTYKGAWLSLHPDCKPESAGRQGYRMMERVREAISEREIHAMLGMSADAVVSAIGRGLVSQAKKSFILPKSGTVIETEPYDDTANQLAAAGLAAKILKMVPDDEKGSGPVVVQIVSYLGGPAAEQKPWVGGGRVGPDGTFRPTVGPNSYAALVARGALPAAPVTVELGDRRGERDD